MKDKQKIPTYNMRKDVFEASLAAEYDRGVAAGIKHACDGMAAALIIVMHDKYGFREKRLKKLVELVNFQFNQCLDGEITIDEIITEANDCYPGFRR